MTHSAVDTVATRVERVRRRIAQACARARRDPSEVTLVAVGKTFPAESLAEAFAAGVMDFGENRVQEALPKIAALKKSEEAQLARFHLVGHLQSNKAAVAANAFDCIHSVDSARLLLLLDEAAIRPLPVFIEVNLAGEQTKYGIAPASLESLLEAAARLDHVRLAGLMTVPPVGERPEDSRRWFAMLRELARGHGLQGLSMGMTEDFEVAIEEGATHVRVGRAIFGERNG